MTSSTSHSKLHPRVAIAGYRDVAPEFRDDELLLANLRARGVDASTAPWDDEDFPWNDMDLVVARTVWDYVLKYDRFMVWLDGLTAPVENDPDLLRWNSDKRYLDDLLEEGLPVVPTTFVGPGERAAGDHWRGRHQADGLSGRAGHRPLQRRDGRLRARADRGDHGPGQDGDGPALPPRTSRPAARPRS